MGWYATMKSFLDFPDQILLAESRRFEEDLQELRRKETAPVAAQVRQPRISRRVNVVVPNR
jgi:hypothetical protein